MNLLRRAATAFWIALALLAAQQASVLHGITHAVERLAKQDESPQKPPCDQCFLFAELSGAVGSGVATLPTVALGATPALFIPEGIAVAPSGFSYRSRAPPSSLA